MSNQEPINEEKVVKTLEAALRYYDLDSEYSVEKLRSTMSKIGRRDFGDLVSKIISKANIDSVSETNKLLELLYTLGNIIPHVELGGLSPEEMIKWRFSQQIQKIDLAEFSNTELLRDVIHFLTYVKENKIVLTQTLQELKRKDIYAINSALICPEELEPKVGDRIFRIRYEEQARTVHFLKILTDVSGLIKKRLNKITITKKGEKFLLLPSNEQFMILFETWLFDLNWSSLQYFDDEFVEAVQDEIPIVLFRLVVLLDAKSKVLLKDFNNQLLAMLELSVDKNEANSLSYTTKRMLLARLEYFGFLNCAKSLEPETIHNLWPSGNNEYSLTEFGKKYLTNFVLRDTSEF